MYSLRNTRHRIFLFLFFLTAGLSSSAQLIRKSEIRFPASDGLPITADHYFGSEQYPYILLFHQELSSRAEYDSIAYRFVKMKYNCLSVDLRSGESYEFTDNQTAKRARNRDVSRNLRSSERDILASIEFADSLSGQAVILLGSSASATLCLKVAENNPRVAAVLAFSPGEFFQPDIELKEIVSGMNKPVFFAGSKDEIPYLLEIFSAMDPALVTMPRDLEQNHFRGTDMLRPENPLHDQLWLSLLLFIKSIQN